MGRNKNWFRLFVPPSAEDFKGLLYRFLGKGRQGDLHMKYLKAKLIDPFSQGIKNWNLYGFIQTHYSGGIYFHFCKINLKKLGCKFFSCGSFSRFLLCTGRSGLTKRVGVIDPFFIVGM